MSDILCSDCELPISKNRIEFTLEFTGKPPTQCIDCAPKGKPLGFMGPEGKTGAGHLNIVQPDDPALARIREYHKRGAGHCTAG